MQVLVAPGRVPRAPPTGPVARCGGLSGRSAASAQMRRLCAAHRDGAMTWRLHERLASDEQRVSMAALPSQHWRVHRR